MSNLSPAFVIPDSLLAKEATGILREYSSDLIFNHSVRVYLFAAEQGRRQKLRFDAELLYIAAAFHDLGLSRKFSSENERFEVDGANAARQFLSAHSVPEEQVRTVWEAIALHTTPGIGTVNAGVSERYLPGFKSPNACDLIASSPFPDSD
jgi:HD superfamily phosphodiesterase